MMTGAANNMDGFAAIPRRDNPEAVRDYRAPPKKRRRIVISCTECHRRKQKVCAVPYRPCELFLALQLI